MKSISNFPVASTDVGLQFFLITATNTYINSCKCFNVKVFVKCYELLFTFFRTKI